MLSLGLMAANVIAYGYQLGMSRLLLPGDYGIVITLTAIAYVLVVIVRTFQAWVIKAIADGGTGLARATSAAALRVLLPLGGAIFVALWAGSRWIADFLQLTDALPIVMLGLYVWSSVLLPIGNGLLLGLGRLRMAAVVAMVDPIIRIASGVTLILAAKGASGALLGFAIGACGAFALSMKSLWPTLRQPSSSPKTPRRFAALDRYSTLMLIANVSLMSLSSIDQVAIKHYFSAEVAGNYSVAFMLGRVILNSTMALTWVLFTRSATMSNADPGRRRLLTRWIAIIATLALIPTVAAALSPGLVARIMGGSQYHLADGYVALVGAEMTVFSLVYVQAYYLMSIRQMRVVWPLVLAMPAATVLLITFHNSVQEVILVLVSTMLAQLAAVTVLCWRSLHTPTPSEPAPTI